jgi:hypothetical protein
MKLRLFSWMFIILQMLHDWYWFKFSYADNRFCMFLEEYLPKRLVRWLAFHCYVITMVLLFSMLATMLVSYAGDLIDLILNQRHTVSGAM